MMRQVGKGILAVFIIFGIVVGGVGLGYGLDTGHHQPDQPTTNATNGKTKTIKIQAGDPIVTYTLTSDNLTPLSKADTEDNSDIVYGNTVNGRVGKHGIDTYRYSGSIRSFHTSSTSSLIIWINGNKVDPTTLESSNSTTPTVTKTSTATATATSTATTTTETSQSISIPTPTATSTSTTIPASNYQIRDLNLSTQPIQVGTEVTVNVTVANTGSKKIQMDIGLATEGEVVDSETVGLFPPSVRQVSFQYRFDSPGTYTMEVGPLNESGSITSAGEKKQGSKSFLRRVKYQQQRHQRHQRHHHQRQYQCQNEQPQ